ncbi:hypothetical protein [Streptomyces sp. NPDC059651]|uniref:hypothetical protein n=1 Tax=Streptomyces sp. NPDC059651 TaxID=3346897 RepID=UPI0036D0C7F4
MPNPIWMSRRSWVAASAVLCAAAPVAAGPNGPTAPAPRPASSVGAECPERVADIETQVVKNAWEGADEGMIVYSRVRTGTEDDCRDGLRIHVRGDQ